MRSFKKRLSFKKCVALLLCLSMNFSILLSCPMIPASAASDTTAPTGTISANNTAWTNGNVTLTCTASDSGGSGLNNVLPGARNLIRGSQTLSGLVGYCGEQKPRSSVTTDTGHGGFYKVAMKNSSNDPTLEEVMNDTYCSVTKGGTYTESVYFYTDCTNLTFNFTFYSADAGHDNVPATIQSLGGGLYRAYATRVGVLSNSIRALDIHTFSYTSGTYITLGKPKLEAGSAVTPYSPAPEDVNGSKTLTQTASSNGTYYFTLSDTADNVKVLSYSVSNIDKTAPTGTISESPTAWTNGSVTLTCAPSDSGGSGLNNVLLGGRNLIRGSQTLSGLIGYCGDTVANSPVTADSSHSGFYKVAMKNSAGNPTLELDMLDTYINVTKGGTYTESVYFYTDCTNLSFNFTFYSSDGGHDNVPATIQSLGSGLYRAYAKRAGVLSASIRALDIHTFSYTSGTYISVGKPKLESGSAVTPYSPAPEDVNGSKTLTQTASANGTYYFTVSDTADNVKVLSYSVSNIDKTAPTITCAAVTSSKTISPAVDDANSGISTLKWASGTQTASYFASAGTGFLGYFIVSAEGKYTIYVMDLAGNTAVKTVTVDATAPAIACATYSTSRTVTASATDSNGSGVAATKYAAGNQAASYFSTGGTAFSGTFTASADGVYTVYAKDNAGNAAVKTVTVDTVAPTLSLSTPSSWGETQTVTTSASDSTSGISVTKWAMGNQTAAYFASKGTAFTGSSFSAAQNGVYTVYMKDAAGNASVKTVTVNHVLDDNNASYAQSFADLSVASTGMDLGISHIYDSANTSAGVLGKGWSLNLQATCRDAQYTYTDASGATLTASVPNLKTVTLPDGTSELFAMTGSTGTAFSSGDTLTVNTDGTCTVTTAGHISYTYSGGSLVKEQDANGNTVSISVDSLGRVSSVTDTCGRVYSFSYATDSVKVTDPMSRTLVYHLTSGRLSSVTDPMGRTVNTYAYDSSGYLTTVKSGNGSTVNAVTYDSQQRIASLTDENNSRSAYAYDDGSHAVTVTDGDGNTSRTWYNNQGLPVKEQDADGNKTFYQYDANGNMLLKAEPQNGTDEYSAGADQSLFDITRWTYDSKGNLLTETGADASVKSYTYDANGNMLSGDNDDGTTTFYVYDSKGNVTTEAVRSSGTDVYSGNLTADQLKNFSVTKYTYTAAGLLSKQTNPDGSTITYSGYQNGNPGTVTDSAHGTTTYTYNILGWNTGKGLPDGTNVSISYNSDEQIIRSKTGDDVTRFLYDGNGWLVQQIDKAQYVAAKDGLNQSPAADTYSDANVGTRYSYDTHGNVIKKTSVQNNTTVYTYDNSNKVVKTVYNGTDVTRYVYDSKGRLVQQINPDQYNAAKDGLTGTNPVNTYADATVGYRYVYDSDGNVTTETYPNGQVFHYDTDGKVTSVDNHAKVNTVGTVSYTYSGDNIETISENAVQKVKYYYDDANELIREDNLWKNQTITYSYDSRGNLLSKSVYAYTTADTITAAATDVISCGYAYTADPDRMTSYDGKAISYDANGNMTAFDGWAYTFSGKNLAAAGKTGTSVTYAYTADGFRTQKTVNGVTTAYTLDDDNNVIAETNGTDTLRFIRDAGGALLGFTLNGVKYTYEKNAQGDISGILDSAGNEVVTYAYDSWGSLLSIGGSMSSTVGVKNPFRYRGYYYDTETGLYYLQSRYYNPTIARFISKDDQSYHEGDTGIAANLYAYANNNPVMYSDPDGHFSIPAWMISVPIDGIILWAAGYFSITWLGYMAPLKFMAKKVAAAFFTAKIAPILRGLTGTIISVAKKALTFIGKKALAAAFNMMAKAAIAAIINDSFRAITALTSVGGLIAAMADYFSDKKFNGWVKL